MVLKLGQFGQWIRKIWIGHNCLEQQVTEGKIKGGIKVVGRRGRRRRKLLDGKERREHFAFVFCVWPAVTHRMYCSRLRLIVLTPL
jgi:hypothetical protein